MGSALAAAMDKESRLKGAPACYAAISDCANCMFKREGHTGADVRSCSDICEKERKLERKRGWEGAATK